MMITLAHIDLYAKNTMWTVGQDYFLHSFFSTIADQLEDEAWGSRFPALMKDLYSGRLSASRVSQARRELATIRAELAELPPDARVYAFEEPERPTPWPVPPGANTLADAFLTSNGDNLLDSLAEAFDVSEEIGADIEIRPFSPGADYTYFVSGER